jgi:anhydro-N-acetylmuramic acid kinase
MSGARAPAGPRRAAKAKGAAPRARAGAWESWVGVMSGTSLDGVDAVLAEYRGVPPSVQWRLVAHAATPFDTLLRRRLLGLAEGRALAVREAASLHFALGELYGTAVLGVLHAGKLSPEMLSGVTLSGQTVFHQSPRRAHGEGVSLQLGSGPLVAQQLGVAVVSDLRAADLAAGGEGAPLVPYADWLLFRSETEGRALLNVGGIANLTAFPAAAGPEQVVAFDTGPGNLVMDGIVRELGVGRDPFDRGGARAGRGRPHHMLVEDALRHPFFSSPPPRSAGREEFGDSFVTAWIGEGRRIGLRPEDLLATACLLTAESISRSLREYVRSRFPLQALYAGGGGAYNSTLLRMLVERLPGVRIETTKALGVPPECREALAFAVLGRETLAGRPGNLPQVTGATRRVILGSVSDGRRV